MISISDIDWEQIRVFLGAVIQTAQFRLYAISTTVILLSGYFILLYNNLVRLQKNIGKAWANIEVLLKQRRDELIKLVAVCNEHTSYEQSLQTTLVNTRSTIEATFQANDVNSVGETENNLRKHTHALFAIAENIPNLKSDQSYQRLQKRVSDMEIAIADRREFYNETVTQYNNRIQTIPDMLVASLFHFTKAVVFQFDRENEGSPS